MQFGTKDNVTKHARKIMLRNTALGNFQGVMIIELQYQGCYLPYRELLSRNTTIADRFID